jgi:hypothetical protein
MVDVQVVKSVYDDKKRKYVITLEGDATGLATEGLAKVKLEISAPDASLMTHFPRGSITAIAFSHPQQTNL